MTINNVYGIGLVSMNGWIDITDRSLPCTKS